MKTRIVDLDQFSTGLRLLEDSAKAPLGSARNMRNVWITDRGGISKRPGTLLLGTENASVSPSTGFFIFKKAYGNLEIPVKSYSTYLEYYHANSGWSRLEGGFTSGSEWGFKEHTRNVDNEDYLYGGNQTEEYRRWNGAYTQLNGALAGGETTVTVDGTLKSNVLYSGTATSNSATTLTVSTVSWAADQWINFYVLVKAGTHIDKVRKITDSDATSITFDTLGSGPGNVAFEIRQLAFPASGTLVINNEEVAYSAVPTQYTFTTSAVAGAHADNSPVTVKPTAYPGAPKGNRLEVNLDRMLVGNVRSALSRDSSGNIQGSQNNLSLYVSKLRDATDFAFAASRAAGEGDIIAFPEGSSQVVDIANQEDQFYVFTKSTITGVSYSQDTNDIAVKTPVKGATGAVGRVIKGENDIYFVTPDNKISSIGRQLQKDQKPEVVNQGLIIKRLTDGFDFTSHAGIKHKQRIYHAAKSSSDESYNNRVLVYNEQTRSYEGLWTIGAFGFGVYGNELYYASARTPNVYKMLTGVTDQVGTTTYAIDSLWESNWVNLTPSKSNLQGVHAYFVEGFIWGGTTITFHLYKDYSSNPSLSFDFGTDNTTFLDDSVGLSGYLGANPLGLNPLGSLSPVDTDGSRHFTFLAYFPYIYGNFFSVGLSNSEKTARFDITRVGLGITEESEFAPSRILTI